MGREESASRPGTLVCAPDGAPLDQRLRGHRLTAAQYREIFDAGRSMPGKLLVIWWRVAPGAGGRLGVVTSRRTLRRAVDRNRARRLLRETFRLCRANLRGDADVLLVARTRLAKAGRHEVDDDFQAVCRRVGLWRNGAC